MKRRDFVFNLTYIGTACAVAAQTVLAKSLFSSEHYKIEQFEVKGIAHFSYIVQAGSKIIVIDPQRNPQVYLDYAKKNFGQIVGIVETHPHADFVSGHLELQQKLGVPVYTSKLTRSRYQKTGLTGGQVIKLDDQVSLRALHTPGHAPDHIAMVLVEGENDVAVFSGDALFIGDVGRPDLREFSKETETQRMKLAEMMYDTIHGQFAKLDDDVILYPAHGAGSLCGKSIRKAQSSTIGEEKKSNYAFQIESKAEFVKALLSDQPFIPAYFKYDVELNLKGAPDVVPSKMNVKRLAKNYQPESNALIIDARPAKTFKSSYIENAVNIPGDGAGFVTWLGTMVPPDAQFYLISDTEQGLQTAIDKAATIGYELNSLGVFLYDSSTGRQFTTFDKLNFNAKDQKYTYIDVRTEKESKQSPLFAGSINIPLQELEIRVGEIPTDKPILIHCASGYRSAAASSWIKMKLPKAQVYDLGADVIQFLRDAGK